MDPSWVSVNAVYITIFINHHLPNFQKFHDFRPTFWGETKQVTRMMLPRTKLFLYKSLSPGWRPWAKVSKLPGALTWCHVWGATSIFIAFLHSRMIPNGLENTAASLIAPFKSLLPKSLREPDLRFQSFTRPMVDRQKNWGKGDPFSTHDGSMGLVYLPTWMVDSYGKCS